MQDCLSSPLYFNNNICIGGSHIFYSTWYKKGLIYINDMYKENGSLYTIQELQDIYKIKTNFLTYNGLIASINSFKSLIQNNVDLKKLEYLLRPNYCWLFFKSARGCYDFYELLNRNVAVPTSQTKWESIYDIEANTWRDIYYSPFK